MFCLGGLEEQIESHLQAPQPSILGQLGKLGNLKSVQTSLQKKISESPLKKLRLPGNLTKFQVRHKLILLGRLPTVHSLGCLPRLWLTAWAARHSFAYQKNSTAFSNLNGSSGSSSKTSTSTARSYKLYKFLYDSHQCLATLRQQQL